MPKNLHGLVCILKGYVIKNYAISSLGSILFLAQPVSSLMSGFVTEPIGRKYSMILVNIPNCIAWLLVYFSHSVKHIYAAEGLLGFCIGLMEAPVITYVGEICLPWIRGVLLASSNLASSFGVVSILLINAIFEKWRYTALLCAFVPMGTAVLLCFVGLFNEVVIYSLTLICCRYLSRRIGICPKITKLLQ